MGSLSSDTESERAALGRWTCHQGHGFESCPRTSNTTTIAFLFLRNTVKGAGEGPLSPPIPGVQKARKTKTIRLVSLLWKLVVFIKHSTTAGLGMVYSDLPASGSPLSPSFQ